MPGSADPVLGSTAATLAVAVVVAAIVVVPARRLAARGVAPRTLASAVGVPYAASALVLWTAARYWGPVIFPDYQGPFLLAGWLVGAFVVIYAQVAVPAYSFARWRLTTALPTLFVSAAATWYAFLFVNGETDVLWLWVVVYGPALIAGTLAALGIEVGVRRSIRGR